MSKKKIAKMEFRYYEIPQNEPLLALMGDRWKINYGKGVNYLHFHNLMEIGYCHYGKGELVLESQSLSFSGGMFSVIPKNFPHTTNSEGDDVSFWEYLFVDSEQVVQEFYKEDIIFAQNLLKRINRRAIFIKEENNPRTAVLIKGIFDEMRDKKEFYQDSVKGLLLSLFVEIYRMNMDDSEILKPISGCTSQIAKALDYVSKYYDRPLRVEELAAVCHISETHFRRVFEESMNMTPLEYINLIRIQMACSMMRKSSASMADIAIKVGFQSVSTFHRNFKKLLEISPYQWKNNADNYECKLQNFKISAHKGW